jgi:CxxC motif-containing protein
MVTTTVQLVGGALARLPVKTRTPVPKTLVLAVCRALRGVRVTAPVSVGDVILADVLGAGVDVVATRSCCAHEAVIS